MHFKALLLGAELFRIVLSFFKSLTFCEQISTYLSHVCWSHYYTFCLESMCISSYLAFSFELEIMKLSTRLDMCKVRLREWSVVRICMLKVKLSSSCMGPVI